MANVTYTVKKGDTLTAIARTYSTTVAKLVELNHISDPDYIVVGQVLIVSGTAATKPVNNSSMATIKAFGLQSNTDRSVYATWTWDRSNTDHYEVKWTYATGDGVSFIGNTSDVKEKQSVYTAPANAISVAFYVRPVSKTYKSNNRDVKYWTASWSTLKRYYFSENPPSTPPVPTVELDGYKLTAKLSNLNVNGKQIEFQVVSNDSSVYKTGKANIVTNSATFMCTIEAGREYKVRCRAIRDNKYSGWSDYSSNVGTGPAPPKEITEVRALSETSVYISWAEVTNATSYQIEYTTDKEKFDSSNEPQSLTVESVVTHAEITGLDSGEEWFFRVRSTNSKGDSAWTSVKSIKIGTPPSAPTTWSLTTTAMVGELLYLYWVHNSEDGSSQTYAELELIIDGERKTYPIRNTTSESEKDKTSSYEIDTSIYTEGTKIQWRVRTRGIIETFGEWSIQRTVDIYAPPTLSVNLTNASGNNISTLTSFPFYIKAVAGPSTQYPLGYHVSVISKEIYETVDSIGNPKIVNENEEVYSKHFDTNFNLLIELSAGSIHLENNISYSVVVSVSMDSGLTTETSVDFNVAWADTNYWPNASIGYDKETYSTYICPNCVDNSGALIKNVTLSVYRREFNGTFTELATNIPNGSNTYITDPHPSLDFARYRIVSTDTSTGNISFYDVPGYPINEKAVIIQWNEKWSNFDTSVEDALEEPAWSGSLLRLPYNIDVSESNSKDVELVNYIGREHPVSYYGTHINQTDSWSVAIDKQDKDTLYALRRLQVYMGDVYVREPSGCGYWANISVSFGQKHTELTIPVSLDIKRVTGGI